MSCRRSLLRSPAASLLTVVALASCAGGEPPTGPLAEDAPSLSMHREVASLGDELAELRRLTAPFHRLERAMEAGWSAQLTECLENPGVGAMGFHYGNPALIDGSVSLLEPETLVFAPWRNGELRLVALEYIVPQEAWTAPDPPELLGHHFHRNDEAGIWALHVWLWQHNPDGLFADWNPRMSCDF